MKRFLRYYLPAAIIFASLGCFLSLYLLKNHPLLLQYPLGYASLYATPLAVEVKINGIARPDVRVYRIDAGQLLVYAPATADTPRAIVVDSAKNDIGLTNAGEDHYALYFDRYLLRAESAYGIVYASNAAKWGYDPHLKITEAGVSYTTERLQDGVSVDVPVEILFVNQ